MNIKKLTKIIVILIIIIMIPGIMKLYNNYKLKNGKLKEEMMIKQRFNKSLRCNLKLDDKKYYYENVNTSNGNYINGKGLTLKYCGYGISKNSEYVITKIDEEKVRLYCDMPVNKDEKEYIKSFGQSYDIDVMPFNDSRFVFVSINIPMERGHNYILDLDNKSVRWRMSDKLDGAYYDIGTNTVICSRNVEPSDKIWGKMEYIEYEVNMYGEVTQVEK